MEILIQREASQGGATIGRVSFVRDGEVVFRCWSLEDEVRPDGVKVPGRTAIPAGTYKVRWSYSPRFKRFTPEILDVPMFTGVRIHAGNTVDHTEGCPLLGMKRGSTTVFASKVATAMGDWLVADCAQAKEAITITITNLEGV